jgi:excisionase family DNA binding protein
MRERILTADQVARILQIHPFTVLKYIKQGKLKGSKLGKMYRIRESDVEAFLNQQTAVVSSKDEPSSTDSMN